MSHAEGFFNKEYKRWESICLFQCRELPSTK